MEEGHPYKVVRLLDDLLPKATKPTKSGVRLDCRLYFREKPNGDLWAEVVFVNPATGNAIHSGPSESIRGRGRNSLVLR